MLLLRWTKVITSSGTWFDSNLVIIRGLSGVHIEMEGNGNSVTTFQSMTGNKFVTCFQDYFGDIWDKVIPHPGIGQVMKFRVNKLPEYACIRGNIEDAGDIDPDDPDGLPQNVFCGSEAEPFRDIDSEFLLGKQLGLINP